MAEEKAKKGNGKVKVGAVIILAISVVVFIFMGVGLSDFFNSEKAEANKPIFGKYDGKEIAWEAGSDFAQRIANYVRMYESYGINVDSNSNIRDYIFQQSYQECLQTLAYTAKVKKAGYSVPSKVIDRQIINYFLDENGVFDEKAYLQADKNTINTMRKDIEKQYMTDRYVDDVLGNTTFVNGNSLYGTKVSSKELAFIAKMGSVKHSFDLAQWDTSTFPNAEVVKYAKDNAKKFTKYDFSAITVDSKEDAESILNQLNASEITFEDAVSVRSTQIYSDAMGKLTSSYAYAIENEVLASSADAAALYSLSKGALSSVVETKQPYSSESSWTIFRCDGAAEQADLSMEEEAPVLSIVSDYLKAYEKGYIENYFIQIAKTFATEAKVSSFDEACDKFEITKEIAPAFPINYGNSEFFDSTASVGALSGASRNEDALASLFKLDVDQLSEPLVMGSYVVVAKCTGEQEDDASLVDTSVYSTTISSNNEMSVQDALMKDPKVDDRFLSAYFKYVGMPSGFAN